MEVALGVSIMARIASMVPPDTRQMSCMLVLLVLLQLACAQHVKGGAPRRIASMTTAVPGSRVHLDSAAVVGRA